MKCQQCPALRQEGYEYPEEYCAIGVQDEETIEFKDGSIGCQRRSLEKLERDIEKQGEIESAAFAEMARGMVEFINKGA